MTKIKNKFMKTIIDFFREEEGLGTVELILIIVVLISLVIIFKEQLTTLVNNVFAAIMKSSATIYS